jgi:hypothetical protein
VKAKTRKWVVKASKRRRKRRRNKKSPKTLIQTFKSACAPPPLFTILLHIIWSHITSSMEKTS